MTNTTWQLIDESIGIWEATYKCPPSISRTVAFRLKSGGYMLYSAGADLVPSAQQEFLGDSQVEVILVPNSYHHIGVAAWKEIYPNATVVASDVAIPRLNRLGYNNVQPLSVIKDKLPQNLAIQEPPSTRNGEVWLVANTENGIIWVVCDAFFNYTKKSKGAVNRFIQIAMGTGPGLTVSRVVYWSQVRSHRRYRKWISSLLQRSTPTILIPSHGKILKDSRLSDKLRELI